jgi:excisionase family DNA binding protein
MEKRYLSLSEAADALDISERTAYRWINSGKLRAYKPGRDYRIPESAVKKAVEESEVRPKGESRSSHEPSLFNGFEEERRSPLSPWAEYARRMAGRIRSQIDEPNSPAFRDARTALFFVEEKNHEAAGLFFLLFEEEMGQSPYGDELLSLWEELLSAFEELAEALAKAEDRADEVESEARERADDTEAGREKVAYLDQMRRRKAAAVADREQASARIFSLRESRGA